MIYLDTEPTEQQTYRQTEYQHKSQAELQPAHFVTVNPIEGREAKSHPMID